jgi:hypothetical protein
LCIKLVIETSGMSMYDVRACVCLWYGVHHTSIYKFWGTFFSVSAVEAVLPQLNGTIWVKTSSIMVAILCTKSERFLPDSLTNYACQLSSPWGRNNAILFPSSYSVQLCTLKVPHRGDVCVQYHSVLTVLLLATGRWAKTECLSAWFPIDRTI